MPSAPKIALARMGCPAATTAITCVSLSVNSLSVNAWPAGTGRAGRDVLDERTAPGASDLKTFCVMTSRVR
jgi:hypothetical protein